jgi:hypothetical protein
VSEEKREDFVWKVKLSEALYWAMASGETLGNALVDEAMRHAPVYIRGNDNECEITVEGEYFVVTCEDDEFWPYED